MSIVGNRPALGRGLGALIPGARTEREEPPPPRDTDRLPLDVIQPSPDQPRTSITADDLEGLAASIREHGVLQPVLVTRAADGGYALVAGERRWRAARLAGLTEIPAVITDLADADVLTVALVENLQREDLSPVEEAHAYHRLLERFSLTQEQVAQRVGRSRVAVTNALRLLQLPSPILQSLGAAEITAGHARAILGAPEDARLSLWDLVRRRGLSVRQTEASARMLRAPVSAAPAPPRRRLPGDVLAQERLQAALNTRVTVQRRRRSGGKVVIQWYDDEQLEALVSALVAAARPLPPPPAHLTI